MKNGGLILLNAFGICEMSKNSLQMEEHLVNVDLQNHLQVRSFRMAHRLNIILFQRWTSQGSINLLRKCYLDDFLFVHRM